VKTRIENIKLITEDGILSNRGLLIHDDVIEKIYYADDEPQYEADQTINGQGAYLSPGFIDIHTHGNSGYDGVDGTLEAVKNIASYHLKNGVTSFLGTTVTSSKPVLEKSIESISTYQNKQAKDSKEATVEGIYFEGPFFNVKKKGAQPQKSIVKPSLELIKHYVDLSNDAIKVVALAPEIEGAFEVVNYLNSKNITTAIAHTDSTYEEAALGIEKGMRIATHLFNGMRGFTHREPGTVGAVLNHDSIYAELIVDGVHLHHAAVNLAIKAKGTDKLILISDAMRAAGLSDGKYDLAGQEVTVENGEARLADGTIAGSTLNLNKAIKNVIKHNNVSIEDAVKMASTNPAKAIGIFDRKGSIAEGKTADLVFFDETITIKKVMKNGYLFDKF